MSVEPVVIPEPPEALTLEQIQELQRNHRRLEYWLQPRAAQGGVPTFEGGPRGLVRAVLRLAEEALRLHAIAAADPACPIAEATTIAIAQLKRSSP